MNLPEIALFFAVSFVAAALNSVAGGGTFLTFPVFIFNGLNPLQANIMSTVALWPGTIASAWGYRNLLEDGWKALKIFFVIGLLGGAAGALLLLSTPEALFNALVPWLLLAATLIFTFGRFLFRHFGAGRNPAFQSRIPAGIGMMAIALYGGYFGAGIGILTLAMLQLMGRDHIHRMNAVKTLLTASINTVTLLIFLFSGKVVWMSAPAMIIGGIAGGYAGARLALKAPPQKVRLLVSCIGFAMTAYFFLK